LFEVERQSEIQLSACGNCESLRRQIAARFAALNLQARIQSVIDDEKKSPKTMCDFFRFFSSYDGFMLDRMSSRSLRVGLLTAAIHVYRTRCPPICNRPAR
jgi:hypothetical protein